MDTTRRTMIGEFKTKKILIMGLSDTGKSSMTLKFLYGFPDAANQGTEESHYTYIKYKNEDFELNIVDLAGIDEYTPLYSSKYSAKIDGYIFVYSIDDPKSFEFVQKLYGKLYDLNHKAMPAILVGNKSDLKDNRVVSMKQGQKLGEKLGMPFYEVSAKRHSGHVIKTVFESILKEIVKNEDQSNHLKLLKNWDEEQIERLHSLFIFGNALNMVIGLFFICFGIIGLLIYPQLLNNLGITLEVLMIEGLIAWALSFFGYFGAKKEEKEWIVIQEILLLTGFMMEVICIVLGACGSTGQDANSNGENVLYPLGDVNILCLLMYMIIFVHLLIMVFLFLMSWVTIEMSVRRRNKPSHRFALLKV